MNLNPAYDGPILVIVPVIPPTRELGAGWDDRPGWGEAVRRGPHSRFSAKMVFNIQIYAVRRQGEAGPSSMTCRWRGTGPRAGSALAQVICFARPGPTPRFDFWVRDAGGSFVHI